MKKITHTFFLLSTAVLLVLTGCNAPAPAAPTATVDGSAILTQVAATAIVRLTEAALLTPTATLAPTVTLAPPTATLAAATATTAPAATLAPTQAPTQAASPDMAGFVADVNYPDNTVVNPGETFEKVWKLKNTGTSTWTTSYVLVCIDSGKLTCPETTAVPLEVKSGETVDIKVKLTAPTTAGTYQAFFRMRNTAGQFFRLDGGGDLWVKIVVGAAGASPTPTSGTPTTATPEAATLTPTAEPTVEPSLEPTAAP